MKKKGHRGSWIPLLVFVIFMVGYHAAGLFGPETCGDSNESLHMFLQEQIQGDVELLKVKETDRVKAAIYDRDDLGTCIAIFERKLFGLRWEYTGMDQLVENGLQCEVSWLRAGVNNSKCEVVICGDNRGGDIASYALKDAEGVARSGLEANYIIDIYILDGINVFPDDFWQYRPDGSVFS